MTDTWTSLAIKYGRKCAVSLDVDDAKIDAETARQIPELAEHLRPLMRGDEQSGLDYGQSSPEYPMILTTRVPRHLTFDVILTAMVFGYPELDCEAVASDIERMLAPGGLFVLLDHMMPKTRWWQFRPQSFYVQLFAGLGIDLAYVATMQQLTEEVTILAGRRSKWKHPA
jgi:SAM-dependent methyltransferase